MNVAAVYILAVMLVGNVSGKLLPPERSYNILMLLPLASKSHRNVFIPLVEALAERGHKIVVVSGLPPTSKQLNVEEINHGLKHWTKNTNNIFEIRKSSSAGIEIFKVILPAMARDFYNVPSIKKLYETRKEYDLIIMNHMFNEFAYPFVHEVPFITVATPGIDSRQSAVLGNVLNPSYVPNFLRSYPMPMSITHRMINTILHLMIPVYWRNWAVVPLIQKEISSQFPLLPPLLELERNQSLTLMNTHFSIDIPIPLLPSQVEVGAMHCRSAKPLPEDLESWLLGAGPEGVIYFSLGSIANSELMPSEYQQAFLEAFRRLPQRVIWKYEGNLDDIPDNVKISNWLPQQDILAHHNVKVFISHGGLLSLQESIFHTTPLLVLPIFSDQLRNGIFVQNSKLGRVLIWEELTADMIVNVLADIIANSTYKENICKMAASLKDQITTPQERAVFWTEYVIRHRGAPQLRSPAVQLSWVEFLMLDVVALFIMILFLGLLILKRLTRAAAFVYRDCIKKKME